MLKLEGEEIMTFLSCCRRLGTGEHALREVEPHCCMTQGVKRIAEVALFVVSLIGMFSAFSDVTMGYLALGLGGGAFFFNMTTGKLKERMEGSLFRLSILWTLAVPITLGGLGVAGYLSCRALSSMILCAYLVSSCHTIGLCSRRAQV